MVMAEPPHEVALWVAGLVDAGLRGTALLVAAGFVVWLLRDHSAEARHLVWVLALAGLVALPVVSPLLPPLGGSGLPSVERFVRAHGASGGPAGTGTAATVPETARASASASRRAGPASGGERSGVAPPPAAGTGSGAASRPGLAAGSVATSPGWTRVLAALPVSLGTLLSVCWLVGPLTVLGLLLAGKLRIGWIARQAEPVDGAWEDLLGRLRRRVGVRRRVRLLRSREPLVPMAWGIFRPRILLPSNSDSWDRETRRSVLLHELAHVKRIDSVTQLLGRLACALFWFHPLVWVAVSRLRLERERACDDLVLRTGTRATDYARQLVSLARSVRTIRAPVPGSGAVARSQFTERMESLLDPERVRDPVPSPAVSAGVVAAGLLVVAAGLARPPLATAAVGDPGVGEEPGAAATPEAPGARAPSAAPDPRREASALPVLPAPAGDRGEAGRTPLPARSSAGAGEDLAAAVTGGDLSAAGTGIPPVPRPSPVRVDPPSIDDSESRREEAGDTWIPSPAPVELAERSLPLPPPAEAGSPLARGSAASAARLEELAFGAPTGEARAAAVEALAEIPGGAGARPLHRIATTHAEVELRERAVEAIGEVDGKWTVPALVNLVQGDADLSLRHHALEVLAGVDRPAAARALMQIARSHPDPEIRKEAAFRLVDTAEGEALARYVETA